MAAGLGFKTFTTGEVLTAADTNGYLMQGVLVFASAAARDAAITSPQEGQCCYLKDTDAVLTYSGAAWVGFDDSNAIQNTIVDAKGDLVAASGADTPARLAVGSNGETLVADSAATTGLRYTSNFAAGKNKIINGDFYVNQRNFTSTTTSGTFGFDRFFIQTAGDGTCTYSAQTFTPGTAPVAGYEGKNYARIVTTGQTTAGSYSALGQNIEDVRTLAGQTATISFWAKAASGTPKIYAEFAQQFGSGGSPSADVVIAGSSVTLSTSWARYTVTISIPSISGKTIGTNANSSYLITNFWVSAGSTFNSRTGSLGIQSNTFEIWGVQVEAGSVATAFQTATGTIQGELAACQRYYYRLDSSGGAYGWTNAIGYAYNTSGIVIGLPLPVQMRVAPTSIDYSGMAVTNFSTDTVIGSLTSISLNASRCTSNHLNVTIAKTSAFTAAATFTLNKSNNTADYIGASAEL